jgi:alpha-beta hydrolase superfamily lysophospholipase
LLAHGKDEHSGRYGHVVTALTANGYAVFAVDHRGHGRSEGTRGVIDRFDNYVDDFHRLAGRARERFAGVPVYVLGHSMGGLIAARYALAHQRDLAGVMLSGPALRIGDDVPVWQKRALVILGRFFPNRTLPPSEPGILSRDPEVELAFSRDPLCHNGLTKLGFARALVLASEATLPRAPEMMIPMLVMHGAADTLTSPLGSKAWVENATSTDKELKLWPAGRHEIFNDLDKEQAISHLRNWLDTRVRRST